MGVGLKPRTQAGLPGLEVNSVAPGSAAARGGVVAGDVLLMINATAAVSPEQVAGMLEESEGCVGLSLAQHGGSGATPESDSQLTNALVFRGDRSEASADAIFQAHYARFAPLQAETGAFVAAHAAALAAVLPANEDFTQARIHETPLEVQAKQQYFKQLNLAAAAYRRLEAQVAEGTAFFNSALERITAIHDKVRDLTTARAIEREDFASQLEEDNQRKEEDNQRKLEAASHPVSLSAAAPPSPLSSLPPAVGPPSFRSALAMGGDSDGAVNGGGSGGGGGGVRGGGGGGGVGGGSGGGGAAAAAAEEESIAELALEIKQLMEMGFSRDQARGALLECDGQVGGALTRLTPLPLPLAGGWCPHSPNTPTPTPNRWAVPSLSS